MPSTYYFSNKILEDNLNGINPTWVGLFTISPDRDQLNGNEVISPEYSRQIIHFGNANNGHITNKYQIDFGIALNPWGKITHFGIFDAQNNGNILLFENLSISKNVTANKLVSFLANELKVVLI